MCDLPVCDCWLYVQITGMCTLLTCVYLCVCIPGCVLWDIAGIPGLIAKIREACVNNSRIQQSCAKEPCLHNVNKLLKLVKAEGIHIQREREKEQASNHKLSSDFALTTQRAIYFSQWVLDILQTKYCGIIIIIGGPMFMASLITLAQEFTFS